MAYDGCIYNINGVIYKQEVPVERHITAHDTMTVEDRMKLAKFVFLKAVKTYICAMDAFHLPFFIPSQPDIERDVWAMKAQLLKDAAKQPVSKVNPDGGFPVDILKTSLKSMFPKNEYTKRVKFMSFNILGLQTPLSKDYDVIVWLNGHDSFLLHTMFKVFKYLYDISVQSIAMEWIRQRNVSAVFPGPANLYREFEDNAGYTVDDILRNIAQKIGEDRFLERVKTFKDAVVVCDFIVETITKKENQLRAKYHNLVRDPDNVDNFPKITKDWKYVTMAQEHINTIVTYMGVYDDYVLDHASAQVRFYDIPHSVAATFLRKQPVIVDSNNTAQPIPSDWVNGEMKHYNIGNDGQLVLSSNQSPNENKYYYVCFVRKSLPQYKPQLGTQVCDYIEIFKN